MRAFGICPDLIILVALPNGVLRTVKVVAEPWLLSCSGESAGSQSRKQEDARHLHCSRLEKATRANYVDHSKGTWQAPSFCKQGFCCERTERWSEKRNAVRVLKQSLLQGLTGIADRQFERRILEQTIRRASSDIAGRASPEDRGLAVDICGYRCSRSYGRCATTRRVL